MENNAHRAVLHDQPIYEIRVAGQLASRWFDWFDGFTVTNLENGEVLLRGVCVDPSALRGVLDKIFNLHLQLISVNLVHNNDP